MVSKDFQQDFVEIKLNKSVAKPLSVQIIDRKATLCGLCSLDINTGRFKRLT
jgi:hypothetical protein